MRRLPFLALLLATTSVPAAPLGESLYPGLVEFDEAFEFYTVGDFERARVGFRHLAELGDPEAQLNLGVMLAKGEGGPVDRIEGAAWVRAAEDSGMADAAGIRAAIEQGLDESDLATVTARLDALRPEPGESASGPEEPADQMESSACPIRMAYRVSPEYPRNAWRASEMGLVDVVLLIDPDGVVGAAQALYRQGTDEFGRAAVRAIRRWRAAPCPEDGHRQAIQTIHFIMAPDEEEIEYTGEARQYASELLADARNGDAAAAFIVALLAEHYRGLFDLETEDADALALAAAVAGHSGARWLLGARDSRWILLAARQGYAPALNRAGNWSGMEREERRLALLEAARAGHVPAIFNAVRLLASHPEPSQRNGALALELVEALERADLDDDLLLTQARAMAYAETGDTKTATRLQARVVRMLLRAHQESRLARARLAAYQAGKPWRDSGLGKEFGLAGNE